MRKEKFHSIYRAAFTLIFGVFAVLCMQPVKAQIHHSDSIRADHKMNEVVVTGQYGENSLKGSVYKVKLIDQKRIQQQGAVTLKDVMANELNIRISNDPVLGSGLNVQGMNGQNIKIMIDGVPVIGREGGSIDLNQINLSNIERIELVEGPMSVNYGTDALGGVVNLITKKGNRGQTDLSFNSYAESSGKINAGFNYSYTGPKWNFQFNGARNFFFGFNPKDSGRYMIWKPFTQYLTDLAIGRAYNKGTLRYQFSYFDEKVIDREPADITPYYAYGINHYFYTRRLTQTGFWHHQFNENRLLDVMASLNTYRRIQNTYSKDLVTLNETPVATADENDTTTFVSLMSRGTMSYKVIRKNLSAQSGYEINTETNTGRKIVGGSQTISDYNLFGSAEWHALPRLLVKPGIRIIYNTVFKAPVTPSVNIKWDVKEFLIVRASYGRGFRAPSLKELYLVLVDPNHNVFGNPELKAEVSDNFQLSTAFEWKAKEHVFRIEPSTYYNHLFNKISLIQFQPNSGQAGLFYKYANIDEYQSAGLNINSEYRTPRYAFVLGYARNAINNKLNGFPGSDKFYASNEVRFNFSMSFPKQLMSVSLFCKFNGKQQIPQLNGLSQSMVVGYIDAYQMVDFTASKQLWRKRLNLNAGCKNLLDITNVSANMSTGVHSDITSSAMIGMGRIYFIGLQLQFTSILKS